MTFTICFIIPAPSAHSRSPAPPTPHEVVADIVVHVLHLKLFKRLPEHAKPHCRCRTKLAHFKPNNTRIVTMSTISAVPSGPLTVQAADSHRKCQTINYIWLRLISNPVLYPPPSLSVHFSCLVSARLARPTLAMLMIKSNRSETQSDSGKWNFC